MRRNPWPDQFRPIRKIRSDKGKRRTPPPVKPEPRVLATHGSLTILEVRDERGRKALRYVKETDQPAVVDSTDAIPLLARRPGSV